MTNDLHAMRMRRIDIALKTAEIQVQLDKLYAEYNQLVAEDENLFQEIKAIKQQRGA